MKLFVSDLDGTLLNSNKQISLYTKNTLNNLIENGIQFTIATARTPATAIDILKDININLPVILMNGVLLYDLRNEKIIKTIDIRFKTSLQIISILNKNSLNPFLYTIYEDQLLVYYDKLSNSAAINFFNERKHLKEKTFIKTQDYFTSIRNKKIANFLVFGKYENVKKAYEELKNISDITVDFYKDIYVKDNLYNLEIYSNLASKANGIQELKEYINFDGIVCFGDNINDIPMFKASSECYAVENACNELKVLATKTIDTNNNDAVVKQMQKCVS